jgi:hypothetical protein
MAKISFVNSGGGTPGGTTTQVQFNDSGSFGGSSGLVYDKATQTLTGEKVVASSGFTGSLQGTASYAVHAASAGTSTSAASATVATSATTALTASYVLNAVSASFASTAANSSLFDGRNSSSFAGLTANTFTGVQTFNSPITGTTAYFNGDIVINGTASIAVLETRNQQTLMVGDKYIVIMSGAADHVGLDGAGLLFGSGTLVGVTDENGANAYLRYRNAYGKLEVFPGLRVSGSLNTTGGFSAGYKTFTSNFAVKNEHHFCGVNTSGGAVTASLDPASTFASGQPIIIKDIGGLAGSSGKSILISTAGTDKIDGLPSITIAATSGTINLMSDGFSNWFITNY